MNFIKSFVSKHQGTILVLTFMGLLIVVPLSFWQDVKAQNKQPRVQVTASEFCLGHGGIDLSKAQLIATDGIVVCTDGMSNHQKFNTLKGK